MKPNLQHHILLEGCFKDKECQEGCSQATAPTPEVHKTLKPHGCQASTSSRPLGSLRALPKLGPLESCRKRIRTAKEHIRAPFMEMQNGTVAMEKIGNYSKTRTTMIQQPHFQLQQSLLALS